MFIKYNFHNMYIMKPISETNVSSCETNISNAM